MKCNIYYCYALVNYIRLAFWSILIHFGWFWSTLVYSILFGPHWSILLILVHIGLFSTRQSILVYFGPFCQLWFTLVQFGLLWSMLSILVHIGLYVCFNSFWSTFAQFSPFWSLTVLSVYLVHINSFSPICFISVP